MWALYKNEVPVGHKFDSFASDLLGFIMRAKDGSWDCFAPHWCGSEPNRKYAMRLVYNQSLHVDRQGRLAEKQRSS